MFFIGLILLVVAQIVFKAYNTVLDLFYYIIVITIGYLYWYYGKFCKLEKDLDLELKNIQEEESLLEYDLENPEQRAEKLFKSHQFELKKYYDITRDQSSDIFSFGKICIILGIVIIVSIGILFVGPLKDMDFSDKLILGCLGAISSILINYIAIIYSNMYKETVKSVTTFHNKLVNTHHLHYGAFLASKIRNNKLKEQTIADMAKNASSFKAENNFIEKDK